MEFHLAFVNGYFYKLTPKIRIIMAGDRFLKIQQMGINHRIIMAGDRFLKIQQMGINQEDGKAKWLDLPSLALKDLKNDQD